MKIMMFDPDGETVGEINSEHIPEVDDKIRLENGDYYIVNKRTWHFDLNSVALFCAYYGNIE